MNESQYIWKDGVLVEWHKATTHVLSHTLHYGNSVFEGVRAYPTKKVWQSSVLKLTQSDCLILQKLWQSIAPLALRSFAKLRLIF